jgi:HAD superfamily hydrolase (TIGR01549 family)
MIKAVIFDIDGTLIDSVDLHAKAWVEALKHFGHEIAFQDLRSQIGKGGDQILHGLLPPEVIEQRGEEIKDFERIRAVGQRAVLASSGNADEVEQYKEIANIADLIDSDTSSDDAERSKPFPDIFQAALAKLQGLSCDEAVVVGDTPYDAEAARRAQIKSIGVLSGGFTGQALRDAGCIAIYHGPEDLLHRYDNSPLAWL